MDGCPVVRGSVPYSMDAVLFSLTPPMPCGIMGWQGWRSALDTRKYFENRIKKVIDTPLPMW